MMGSALRAQACNRRTKKRGERKNGDIRNSDDFIRNMAASCESARLLNFLTLKRYVPVLPPYVPVLPPSATSPFCRPIGEEASTALEALRQRHHEPDSAVRAAAEAAIKAIHGSEPYSADRITSSGSEVPSRKSQEAGTDSDLLKGYYYRNLGGTLRTQRFTANLRRATRFREGFPVDPRAANGWLAHTPNADVKWPPHPPFGHLLPEGRRGEFFPPRRLGRGRPKAG
jgi:hypothetical protein